MTGNALVVGPSGAVRAGDALSALLLRIAVHLHDLFHTVILWSMDKDTHYILSVPQHIVCRPADNDTGPLVGNHVDGLGLGNNRLLDGAGTQV